MRNVMKEQPRKRVTQKEIKALLHYDSESGIFTWRSRHYSQFKRFQDSLTWNKKHSGCVAGTLLNTGYISIMIMKQPYTAHRLAWLYITGAFPKYQIDHINGIRTDNRLQNLRDVKNIDNSRNHGLNQNNTSGYMGVTWDKSKSKWVAQIKVNRKNIFLGHFNNPKDAYAVRRIAEQKYGFHKNHGEIRC